MSLLLLFAGASLHLLATGRADETDAASALSVKKLLATGRADTVEYAMPTRPRFGFGALDDALFDDQATYEAQLAGVPGYEVFLSVAGITQTKVNAWRAAWPGCHMIAYIDIFNLETAPASGTTYKPLVDALTSDLWMRRVDTNAIVQSLSAGRGYYFFDGPMMDIVNVWLDDGTGMPASVPIMTRWDGVFIDNLDWTRTQASWQSVIDANGGNGNIKVNGSVVTAADLKSMYDTMSALMTEKIHDAYPTKTILPNAAVESNERPDPNINGAMSEQTVSDIDKLRGSQQGWFGPPFYGSQWVRNMAQRAVVLGMTWDREIVLFQFSGTGSTGVKGRMFATGIRKLLATGTATETDTALGLGKAKATGRADETDTADAVAATKVASTGRADETDVAVALGRGGFVGRADETDTAFALGKAKATGRADETDSAQAPAVAKVLATGRADETDEAVALNLDESGQETETGRADETDAALALVLMKLAYAGRADETDTCPMAAFMEPGEGRRVMLVEVRSRTMTVSAPSRTMKA